MKNILIRKYLEINEHCRFSIFQQYSAQPFSAFINIFGNGEWKRFIKLSAVGCVIISNLL